VAERNGAVFITGNTLSAWNVGGGGFLSGGLLGNPLTAYNRQFVLRNAAVMATIVLFGFPVAMQLAIYGMAGDPDDDDRILAFNNEVGRGGMFPHVDITPLARKLPWYKGDPTGQRRVYMRWGKQAYEVYDGWLTEPVNQFLRKMSVPAKIVFEQVTGRSPGSDWNMEFAGQGALGLFLADDSIIKSRVGSVVSKFMPMSLSGIGSNPDAFPFQFIAPVSRGGSAGRVTAELVKLLNTYAEDDSWKEFRKNPKARGQLEGYGRALVEAAERNGYDVDKILNSARGAVLSRLYKGYMAAMDSKDTDRMDLWARRILRVGGTTRGLQTSIKNRRAVAGRSITQEELDAIAESLK
jgi:hypothetical protein